MIAAIHGILEQGLSNKAAKFNGVDSVASAGFPVGHPARAITNNFHLKARVRIDLVKSSYVISTNNIAIIYNFAAGKFEFFSETLASGSDARTALVTSITDNNWHTIEWIYDGATLTGKLDGDVNVTKAVVFTVAPVTSIVIGKYVSGASGYLNGALDWVSIGKDGADIARWEFNETSTTTLNDSIGTVHLTGANITKENL